MDFASDTELKSNIVDYWSGDVVFCMLSDHCSSVRMWTLDSKPLTGAVAEATQALPLNVS